MKSVFGERLQLALNARGVNARWLATEAETSTSNISRYSNGVSYPEVLEIVIRIAKTLNVSIDYLLGLSDVMYPTKGGENAINEFGERYAHLVGNTDFQMYTGVYDALPPKSRAFLTEFVRAYGINQNVLADDGVTILPKTE